MTAMIGPELNNSPQREDFARSRAAGLRCNDVLIAIDESHISQKAIPYGIAVANALGAGVVLLRILEPGERNGKLTDPVEWQLLRQQARSQIETLAGRQSHEIEYVETEIQEGRPSDQICRWARDHNVSLTVICSQGGGRANAQELGRTARCVIEHAHGSVLLVPATVEERESVHYHRIFVPLDGSSRAETALPVALRLAEAQPAEIFLVHAVPEPELTEVGPLEAEDIELRARLLRRNERVARSYLDRVRARLAGKSVPVQILLLCGGDARHLLMRAFMDQRADLVVMASHGHGSHMDVPLGGVASHMIAQTPVPLLLVRNHIVSDKTRGAGIGAFAPKPQYASRTAA